MSMPQFGSDLARDRIERLIEQAQADARVSRRHGPGRPILGRIKDRLHLFGPGPPARDSVQPVRLQRETESHS